MDLVRKIRLTATTSSETPLGAGVKIRTKQGGEYETRVDMPKGHGVLTPLTPAEKKAKFLDNVRFSNTISKDRAEKALELLEDLERVDNVKKIFDLLTA
jgi:2-methylcitrate dehydratase PrpD